MFLVITLRNRSCKAPQFSGGDSPFWTQNQYLEGPGPGVFSIKIGLEVGRTLALKFLSTLT